MNVHFGKLWKWVKGTVTVVLTKQGGDQHTVLKVLKRNTMESTLEGEHVALPQATTVFHMWREKLDEAQVGLRPEEGDTILVLNPDTGTATPDDDTYTIMEDGVHVDNHGERFRCTAYQNVTRR